MHPADETLTLSVILPTYNEAENIQQLLERLTASLVGRTYQLIVVDDDSPDRTWARVAEIAASDPRVTLVRRHNERGLTGALNRGIAVQAGALVAWMDCDFSHPPERVATMLHTLECRQCDVVVASRFVSGGGDRRCGRYRFQRLLSHSLMLLGRAVVRLPVRDLSSGFILLRRECLQAVGPLRGEHGEYFLDLLSRLHARGYQFDEIPYTDSNRKHGLSKTATGVLGLFARGTRYLAALARVGMRQRLAYRREPGRAT